MSLANRMTGKNLFLQWIGSGGTVTVSGDQTAFSPDLMLDTVDVAAGSDVMHGYIAGLKDWSATLEKWYIGTAGTAVDYALREGETGTLIWAPEGTASGKPKWGIAALVSKYSTSFPFNDGAKVTVEFKSNGSDLAYDGRTITW